MTRVEPHLRWASERHLRVAFESDSQATRNDRVIQAMRAVHEARISSVIDVTPAYSTLLVHCDPFVQHPSEIEAAVRHAIGADESIRAAHGAASFEIPVCYCARCGPDLADVATTHAIAPDDVVRLHGNASYRVAFLGFSPGFPYLLGLPETLATPRLDSPRPRVPAGSVGIAGTQTGIYPRATPGGWRLLGRTSATLFDPGASSPTLLRAGDHVRFVRVEHDSLRLPPGSEMSEGSTPS